MNTNGLERKPIFILYGTTACHLCEDAKKVLLSLDEQMKKQFNSLSDSFFEIKEVDIADTDELVENYGTRIPVLLNESLDLELGWPFDESAVYQFMVKSLQV